MPARYLKTAVCLFLVIATFAVYWQVKDHAFINFDDQHYVTGNYNIQGGVTLETVRWAFTTNLAANWHPLTWLSHLVDYQLFGLDPGGHHLTNVLLHAANAVLLFLLLAKLTAALWPSALVAALFALHPLHVESVAWVSERKDVLSAFFFLTTLWAYAWYTAQPNLRRYLLVFFSFALGLMAKPMLVTLPLVLLLLDYWPLGRFHPAPPVAVNGGDDTPAAARVQKEQVLRLVGEKAPLFIMTAAACLGTLVAQKTALVTGAITPVNRLGNALVAYVAYLGKMVWPLHLAIFYPHPGNNLSLAQAAGAGLLLAGATYLVLKKGRDYPYLPVGWFWYLGTLVPVIGLVQVGLQARADRYTYLPLVGIFIILAWGAADITSAWRRGTLVRAAAAGLILSACAVLTWIQVGYWRDTASLFEHALEVTDNNYCAYANLIDAYAGQGQYDKAREMFEKAIRTNPAYTPAYNSMGGVLAQQGNYEEAVPMFQKVLGQTPDSPEIYNRLGMAYASLGDTDKAVAMFQQALKIAPLPDAYNNLGIEMGHQGKLEAAIPLFKKAIDLKPNFSEAWFNLGVVYAQQGKIAEAAGTLAEALRINPHNKGAKEILSQLPH